MAKRRRHGKEKRQQHEDEVVTPAHTRQFFESVLQLSATIDAPQVFQQRLVGLGKNFMHAVHPQTPTKAATDFNMEQALFAFGLKDERLRWRIEDIQGTQGHTPTVCLGKSFKHSCSRPTVSNGIVGIEPLLETYLENFKGSSEAVCRTALDIILNDCLTVMVSVVILSGCCFHSHPHPSERQPKCVQPGNGWPRSESSYPYTL